MKTALFVTLSLLALPTAHAKCAREPYEVSGSISDSAGNAVPGAKVRIEWTELKTFQRSLDAVADSNGYFKLDLSFYPSKGTHWYGGDICTATLKIVRLLVSAQGFESIDVQKKISSSVLHTKVTLARKD